MHRIDTAGSVAGRFQDGDAQAGVRGTLVDAAWLNDIQDNFFEVLLAAGITPVKGRGEDLLEAIAAIAAGAAGAGGGAVPTTRVIGTSGLAIGGGSLAADRTINVAAASVAEVLAGTVANKAMTPAAFAGALANGFGSGSVQIGPVIFKYGTHAGLFGEGSVYHPFATPFPNDCFVVVPIARNDTGDVHRDTWVQNIGDPSADGFTVRVQSSGGDSTGNITGFDFIAIGN